MLVNKSKSFIAISTVLVISVVVIAIGISLSTLSIGEMQTSLTHSNGSENLNLTEGCAEDALLKSRSDINYIGGTLTRPEGTCTVTVSKNATIWTINIVPNTTKYKRTIQVIINRQPTGITLTSWKEI